MGSRSAADATASQVAAARAVERNPNVFIIAKGVEMQRRRWLGRRFEMLLMRRVCTTGVPKDLGWFHRGKRVMGGTTTERESSFPTNAELLSL